ncbi:hypothetical protein L1987_50464 [Smallanthus sonchifolius]|uniref:Uncharacterized protein n=1 Tax=Smallanthus sonchifolius TaxID=185202 RepID=A0ACB9EM36_9ASTR|nr:hypothetical protein L1987_50464 [Smallanthus sonchifolius]
MSSAAADGSHPPPADAVKSGAADVTATEKSESDLVPISPDRDEVIYDFLPGLSTLNVNGRPKFELERTVTDVYGAEPVAAAGEESGEKRSTEDVATER